MREIEFRGKTLDSGEWVYGGVVHQTDFYGTPVDRYYIIDGKSTNDYDIGHETRIDPSTVGQFTGLTDKNGRRIFEGDIVTWLGSKRVGFPATIGYWKPDATFCILRRGYSRLTLFNSDRFLEVVGNIYDNPELR